MIGFSFTKTVNSNDISYLDRRLEYYGITPLDGCSYMRELIEWLLFKYKVRVFVWCPVTIYIEMAAGKCEVMSHLLCFLPTDRKGLNVHNYNTTGCK